MSEDISTNTLELKQKEGQDDNVALIAEAGGVALHYAAYCSAIGAPLPPNLQQGGQPVKWVHLHYDARSAFHYWRRGELTLRDWLRSWRGIGGYAVWSRRDPAPFFCDIVTTIGRGIGKR